MIKVKIDRPADNVFYVEDGVTVSTSGENDSILEVLDEEDAVIAMFRGWVYALPITDEDYLTETGQAEELLEDDEEEYEDEAVETVEFEVPETSSFVHANHGSTFGLDDLSPES
jgi:hypothetical protein